MVEKLSTLHLFKLKDKYLALDVESGALHQCDEVSFRLLELMEAGRTGAEAASLLAPELGEREVQEALGEIEQLKEQGLLWSEKDVLPENGEPLVKALCLFITDQCNLGCRYCFVPPGARHMSAAVGKAAVDFLLEQSGPRRHCEIDYFGGEPLLNWETVMEVTAYAREEGRRRGKEIAFTLTTNGLLLEAPVREYLARENFAVVLSLDGRPEIHNAMRPRRGGGESYRQVLRNLQEYVALDPPGGYYIRGTYTRRNLDFLEDIRHIYQQGFRFISLEPVVAPEEMEHALSREDLPRLREQYLALTEFCLECARKGDPFLFFHFAVNLDQGPCVYKRLSGCGAGREYLAVAADGSLYPCHQFVGRPEFKLGHLLERPPLDRTRMESFPAAGPHRGKCRQCWARYHCGGGCQAAAFLNGNPEEPYALECALQKIRLECALYLQASLGD
ncbi:MAG TPA: thioether cross-link-forming SCIFF peptide maturase [Bacillota bacterium]|nr:thioether cross-link-forming SCIFF peptide maturase [Bacillota bacterium]HOP68713.1 thioether cross-link-forming SCIFF peptide maturase [Bacillota bacterium]HPT33757.1 thioether cross-link-forming SCIFF peptide maturase [Bacillota bacterium]HPZ65498.1 thioether cross-link-forming SCIFF peptide maturase [Bacillota bacterium]HQD06718.1 thioether cross-link-forming SCIFF peptide maturase [Bacillota bacterium]